jgi:predicted nucleotidyltransferase
MSAIRSIDLERLPAIREELSAFARRLKQELPVQRVIVFGSFATGDVHELSDIDLIVVGDFPQRYFDRLGLILDRTELPVEPWVYTPEEFQRKIDQGIPFIVSALEYGVEL